MGWLENMWQEVVCSLLVGGILLFFREKLLRRPEKQPSSKVTPAECKKDAARTMKVTVVEEEHIVMRRIEITKKTHEIFLDGKNG